MGLSEAEIGLLLTLTLLGDTAISLWITTNADRIGRRRMLLVGAALMVMAGVVFVLTRTFVLLLAAATIGVISPSGNEVGPFLSIEQAALSQLLPGERRTRVFAWYNLVGSFATALGALAGGGLAQGLQGAGLVPIRSYQVIVLGYALIGLVLWGLFTRLSPEVEVIARLSPQPASSPVFMGLHKSRRVVFRLAGLFSLDAFAGGFMIQSLLVHWFHLRFGLEPGLLGAIFFGANLLAGLSGAQRCLDCQPDRADQYHGIHPSAFEYFTDDGAAHAQPAPGDHVVAVALQYLPNGCPYPAIILLWRWWRPRSVRQPQELPALPGR